MPFVGEYNAETGSVWTGSAWVGGKSPGTVPTVVASGPNAGQVTTAKVPFAGAVLNSQAPDGTQAWYDPATKQTRFFRGGQEIGATNPGSATGGTAVPAQAAVPTGGAKPFPGATRPPGTGLTAAEQSYYMALAKTALRNLGVSGPAGVDEDAFVDSLIDDKELAGLAAMKATPEMIAEHFATRADLIESNPNLPFGVSKDDYDSLLGGYKAAARGAFGDENALGGLSGTAANRRGSVLGYALQNRIAPQTFATGVERFRQTTGRAPTSGKEFQQFSTQPRVAQATAKVTPYFDFGTTGKPRLPGKTGSAVRPSVK